MKSERRRIWKCLIFAVLLTLLAFVSVGCAADTYTVCTSGCNYTSIQAAINAAQPGDTIIVRDGTYTENVEVNVANLTLRSENGSAFTTVLAAVNASDVFLVTANSVTITGFTVRNANDSASAACGIHLHSVHHCIVSGNNASGNYRGIYLFSSSKNTLSDNTVSKNGFGIYLNYSSNNNLTANTANSNIRYGNSYDGNSYGIRLQSSSNNTLTANTANWNYDYGIGLQSSSNNTLTANTANWNYDYGIGLLFSSTNNLTNNTASDNSRGIRLESMSNNNTLTGNTVTNNSHGILLWSSCNNVLTGNTASYNDYGIYLLSLSNNSLMDNTVSNNNYGIYLYDSSNNNLTGNSAHSNNDYGIYLEYSSNNNLTGNTASNNSDYGIYLDDSSKNTLAGNIASNNEDGISLDSSCNNNTITGNSASYNSRDGMYLSSSSNNILMGNTASYNTYYGIRLSFYSSNNNLTGNTASNNSRDGIILSSSSTNSLTNNTANSNNWSGISLYYCNDNNILTANTANSNNYCGMYLDSSSTNNLTGNTAHLNNENGIELRSSNNNILTGNNVSNSRDGISLYTSSTNNLTGNTASNNAIRGIFLRISDNNTLTGNTAVNNSYDSDDGGILLSESSNNTLTGNTAVNNFHSGIYVYYSSNNNNLTGNKAANNSVYGILLEFSSNSNTLTGNTASNNDYGIYLDSSSNNNLTGNTASLNNKYGIRLGSSSNNNTLTGNTAHSNNQYGIYLIDSSNNSLTGNTVSSNNPGIYLAYSNNNILTGNTAHSNNLPGIELYSSSNNNLTGNTANSNNDNGISLLSSSDNTLTGNSASNNSEYGIYLSYSSTNNLAGNIASNNSQGIYLSSSSTNALSGNIVSNNHDGIYLSSSSDNTLTGNTATWNSAYGMYLSSSSNNHIYNNYFDNVINARDDGTNIWNITNTAGTNILGGLRLGGNYWSDYTGTDADGDGLGDTPYAIAGGANRDYHPLLPYTHTDVGVTTDIELSDPSEIEDLVPPGTDLRNAVVINVNVIDDTPDNPNDNAYSDITIYVCELDVETCRVYKEGSGFLLEVPDVHMLPTVKPPGKASFSRDVTNNSVIVRFYVGDPLLAVLPPPEEVVTISLNNVDVADCGETWSESGIELSFVTTTDEDCTEGYCAFGLGETEVWLYPARLSLNFDEEDGVFTEIEVDIVDWYGLNGTCAFLYNGSNQIDKVCNSISSEKETLKLSSKGQSIDRAAVSSCEGEISEIRLVKSKVYTKTDVGVTSTITIANSTDLAANLPPEYAGMDISNTVVLNVNVTDNTPGNPADDAYTDITINVGTMDIGTCKVFKAGMGFLPEVADVTTLPSVKPPGEPAFSRNVANNTVTVRLYVGDPLLAVLPPAEQLFFDTEEGSYPSISGTHNGTITPSWNLTVRKLYTYPCAGTGGHTEYFKIWNSTGWNVTATWNGYTGDWHNLTFNNSFTLYANQTYNYTIRTGSYPQIIHAESKDVTGGRITCSEFVDLNGKRHEGWIPAIKLY
jgi:parallel beta-helix repeat protein